MRKKERGKVGERSLVGIGDNDDAGGCGVDGLLPQRIRQPHQGTEKESDDDCAAAVQQDSAEDAELHPPPAFDEFSGVGTMPLCAAKAFCEQKTD
ncbi:hypothetical protein [Mycolicibacter engbaekii]|uniref:hypothetical protein n=1 Tax=Mycolicibacter engbaekii TaxID=188915 RepID=UPI0013FE0279|nr:hypothetical protein [Mycolicibacter engbaekii]